MSNTSRKIISIIGIIVGVAIIIIGFSVMNPETWLLGKRDSLGSLISFGADFYTEMYHITYEAAYQVQRAYVNICNAIGWLIVSLGMIDSCFFTYKLIKSITPSAIIQDVREVNKNQARPQDDDNVKFKLDYHTRLSKSALRWNELQRTQGVNIGKCELCGSKKQNLILIEYEDFFGKAKNNVCYDCFCKRCCPDEGADGDQSKA